MSELKKQERRRKWKVKKKNQSLDKHSSPAVIHASENWLILSQLASKVWRIFQNQLGAGPSGHTQVNH